MRLLRSIRISCLGATWQFLVTREAANHALSLVWSAGLSTRPGSSARGTKLQEPSTRGSSFSIRTASTPGHSVTLAPAFVSSVPACLDKIQETMELCLSHSLFLPGCGTAMSGSRLPRPLPATNGPFSYRHCAGCVPGPRWPTIPARLQRALSAPTASGWMSSCVLGRLRLAVIGRPNFSVGHCFETSRLTQDLMPSEPPTIPRHLRHSRHLRVRWKTRRALSGTTHVVMKGLPRQNFSSLAERSMRHLRR